MLDIPPRADDRVDVSSVLDKARFGSLQLVVLALTFLTLVMDGFDIQAIAFAAPALTEAWGIERSSLGPVLAAALLGMAAGAAGIGVLGDRYGRKTALVFSCMLMAAGSLASAFARARWSSPPCVSSRASGWAVHCPIPRR